MPRKLQGILTRESQQIEPFHTAWATNRHGPPIRSPGQLEPERFRCLRINDKLVFVRRLQGKIGGFLAFEDAVDVTGRLPEQLNWIGPQQIGRSQ